MVYTSKIPIPGKTPIGSATGGGYMYADEPSMSPTQNMSTPIKPFTPITSESTGIPNVGVPGVPGITPLVPGIQPTAENAAKINAPVDDVLQINQKIDNNSERVKQLRQHFTALEQKGEYQLDQKQSDYIKRFKTKNPSYENVPDVILYSKIILADPKRQEELGNVGEKSFMQRLGDATLGTITDTGDAIMEGVQAYKDYKPEGIMEQGVAVTSGLGKFVGDTFTNVGANLINLGLPSKDNLQGTTSTSELLGKNVEETLKGAGDIVKSGLDWFAGEGWTEETMKGITDKIQADPEAQKEFEAAMNILNILPGGFANKSAKAMTAKQVLNNIARDAELTMGKKGVFGTATKEAFDAGMEKGLTGGLKTGGATLNEYLKQLPPKKPAGKTIGTKLTRDIPEKTVANYLSLTPTERSNVEKILGGKTAEQYILENNLGGKTKGELTDIFQKQASDSYNGIKEELKKITERIESKGAKTAIDDMLETFDSLSSLEKDVYKRDIDYLRTLKDQNDYSLSELHALRQAFDKVNTGMYTAKGAVRSGTRAGAEVEVRNQLSNDIQENALKQGVDVKKMNQDLRVALTLKDGLLRSLSQESKNNLVGLQDIGIMGIFSGGEPLTALSLGIGKKFLEGKMPSAAQKLFNLNKNAYENTAVKRGNTIATGNGSRLFGLSDNVGSSDAASIPKVKPNVIISKNPAEILAFELSNGKVDIKKAIEEIKKLSPEEIAKHPELVKLQEVDQIVQYIDNVGAEYGALPPDEIQALTKQIQEGGYTPEQKKYILDNSPKEVTTEIQKQNRIRDYGKDFTEKEVVKVSDKPKLKAKTEKKVKAKKETPEVVSTPETVKESVQVKETPEDWTKKDFTKVTESKSTDKYGNTLIREQGKTSTENSLIVGGKKYTELDLPDSSRTLYELDGKIYEYKDGKMISETPKTPQVDTELASLQKLQESLPGLPKVEVPADYVPKDGLPTGTEFESTILPTETKVKGKIPSPDIKRPQIRGIDLGIRGTMIKSLKEQGIFTDSFFAITDKNLANKFIDYAEQKAMKKGASTAGKEVDIKSLMDRAKNSADTSLVPQEYVKGLDGDKGIYLRFDLGDGNKVAVNSSYTDIFFKNFDDVTFKGSNEVSPVVVYSKGKDVGVIMPIKDPYASKEVLGDFTIGKAKTPQVEGKTVLESKKELLTNKAKEVFSSLKNKYKEAFPDENIAMKNFEKMQQVILGMSNDIGILNPRNPINRAIFQNEFGVTLPKGVRETDKFIKDFVSNKKYLLDEKTMNSLRELEKPKPSLPLSQKSEVKYSEPDSLVKEAKKYKSAEEFVKAQETLYHGTQAVKARDYTAIESKMKDIYKKLGHEYKESESAKIIRNAEELVAKRSNEKLSKVQSEIADLQKLLSRKISKPSSKFAGSSNKDVRDNYLGSFLTPDRDFASRFTYDISYDLAGRKTIQQKNGYLVENYFKGNTLDLSKASDYDLDFLAKTLNMPKKDIVAELKTKGGTKEIQKKLAPKKDIISKEYDAVSNYAYDSEAKKWKKEIAVMNDESLYTKQQLLDIYNKANKK